MGGILCKSPLHNSCRLHPLCFAKACSMWSKKPIPVSIMMFCEVESCVAWGAMMLLSFESAGMSWER